MKSGFLHNASIGYGNLRVKQKQVGAQPYISLERSSKYFLLVTLGKAQDKRLELFASQGRILQAPEASHRSVKGGFRKGCKGIAASDGSKSLSIALYY